MMMPIVSRNPLPWMTETMAEMMTARMQDFNNRVVVMGEILFPERFPYRGGHHVGAELFTKPGYLW